MFKAGDIVVRITDGSSGVVLGGIYTVESCYDGENYSIVSLVGLIPNIFTSINFRLATKLERALK